MLDIKEGTWSFFFYSAAVRATSFHGRNNYENVTHAQSVFFSFFFSFLTESQESLNEDVMYRVYRAVVAASARYAGFYVFGATTPRCARRDSRGDSQTHIFLAHGLTRNRR